MIRTLLERFSRDRVLRRRLPPEAGGHTLLVSPDSALMYWRQDLRRTDPLLLRLAVETVRPGDTVWDIGANVGLFSFASAFQAGESGYVVAVEPDDLLSTLLRGSAAARPAGHARVDVVAAAVSDTAGIGDFCIASRGRAGSHLSTSGGSSQTGGVRAVNKVVVVTLDWLLTSLPPPAVLKLDVERAEARCLRGAARLLAEARPVVLCEVSQENTETVREILHGHGYTLFDASAPAAERHAIAEPAWNTLALPPARGRLFAGADR